MCHVNRNNGENGKALSLHLPCVSGLLSTGSKSTHQDQHIASPKPQLPKFSAQAYDPFNRIHNFGSDDVGDMATSKPAQQSQDPPINDIFNFSSFDDGAQGGFEGGDNHNMVINVVEPATKAVGSSKLKTKKVVVGSGGLAKSGDVSGGKMVIKASEKTVTNLMDKWTTKKGSQEGDSQGSRLD